MKSRLAPMFFLLTVLIFFQCADEDPMLTSTPDAVTSFNTTTPATTPLSTDCSCDYIVPSNAGLVDGQALSIQPGHVICLDASKTYGKILFRNIRGTATQPVVIKNCGGAVTIVATGLPYAMKTEKSQYFKISGGAGSTYGIRLNGGQLGLTLDNLSTNFEVDHVEIFNSGFAGIMAKTDPTCDNATHRGNFTMRDISLHHNYVHDTGGEGFYIGNSFYSKGINTPCGIKLPHIIEGVKVFNNIVKNSGWESIQIGSAPKGAEVFNNTIENYGTKNVLYQNNGIQFGEGAPGKCYGNFIKRGKGTGLIIIGNGENFIHDNIIVETGSFGIFCDEREFPGLGFRIMNNTLVNTGSDGIRLYSDKVSNIVLNNIIANPKSYSTYTYPRTGNDAYVYLLNKTMNVVISGNKYTRSIDSLKFSNAATYNFRLTSASPVINKGKDISIYNIPVDYYLKPRLKGVAYDVGASEY
ncbi:MAG: right-handed parallel beta-helix repeat-containing protein [Bacteroidota bacterium]